MLKVLNDKPSRDSNKGSVMNNPKLQITRPHMPLDVPGHRFFVGNRRTFLTIASGEKNLANASLLNKELHSYVSLWINSNHRTDSVLRLTLKKFMFVHIFNCKVAQVTNIYLIDKNLKDALAGFLKISMNVLRNPIFEKNKEFNQTLKESITRLLWTFYSKYHFYLKPNFTRDEVWRSIYTLLDLELPTSLPEFFNDFLDHVKKLFPPKLVEPEVPYYIENLEDFQAKRRLNEDCILVEEPVVVDLCSSDSEDERTKPTSKESKGTSIPKQQPILLSSESEDESNHQDRRRRKVYKEAGEKARKEEEPQVQTGNIAEYVTQQAKMFIDNIRKLTGRDDFTIKSVNGKLEVCLEPPDAPSINNKLVQQDVPAPPDLRPQDNPSAITFAAENTLLSDQTQDNSTSVLPTLPDRTIIKENVLEKPSKPCDNLSTLDFNNSSEEKRTVTTSLTVSGAKDKTGEDVLLAESDEDKNCPESEDLDEDFLLGDVDQHLSGQIVDEERFLSMPEGGSSTKSTEREAVVPKDKDKKVVESCQQLDEKPNENLESSLISTSDEGVVVIDDKEVLENAESTIEPSQTNSIHQEIQSDSTENLIGTLEEDSLITDNNDSSKTFLKDEPIESDSLAKQTISNKDKLVANVEVPEEELSYDKSNTFPGQNVNNIEINEEKASMSTEEETAPETLNRKKHNAAKHEILTEHILEPNEEKHLETSFTLANNITVSEDHKVLTVCSQEIFPVAVSIKETEITPELTIKDSQEGVQLQYDSNATVKTSFADSKVDSEVICDRVVEESKEATEVKEQETCFVKEKVDPEVFTDLETKENVGDRVLEESKRVTEVPDQETYFTKAKIDPEVVTNLETTQDEDDKVLEEPKGTTEVPDEENYLAKAKVDSKVFTELEILGNADDKVLEVFKGATQSSEQDSGVITKLQTTENLDVAVLEESKGDTKDLEQETYLAETKVDPEWITKLDTTGDVDVRVLKEPLGAPKVPEQETYFAQAKVDSEVSTNLETTGNMDVRDLEKPLGATEVSEQETYFPKVRVDPGMITELETPLNVDDRVLEKSKGATEVPEQETFFDQEKLDSEVITELKATKDVGVRVIEESKRATEVPKQETFFVKAKVDSEVITELETTEKVDVRALEEPLTEASEQETFGNLESSSLANITLDESKSNPLDEFKGPLNMEPLKTTIVDKVLDESIGMIKHLNSLEPVKKSTAHVAPELKENMKPESKADDLIVAPEIAPKEDTFKTQLVPVEPNKLDNARELAPLVREYPVVEQKSRETVLSSRPSEELTPRAWPHKTAVTAATLNTENKRKSNRRKKTVKPVKVTQKLKPQTSSTVSVDPGLLEKCKLIVQALNQINISEEVAAEDPNKSEETRENQTVNTSEPKEYPDKNLETSSSKDRSPGGAAIHVHNSQECTVKEPENTETKLGHSSIPVSDNPPVDFPPPIRQRNPNITILSNIVVKKTIPYTINTDPIRKAELVQLSGEETRTSFTPQTNKVRTEEDLRNIAADETVAYVEGFGSFTQKQYMSRETHVNKYTDPKEYIQKAKEAVWSESSTLTFSSGEQLSLNANVVSSSGIADVSTPVVETAKFETGNEEFRTPIDALLAASMSSGSEKTAPVESVVNYAFIHQSMVEPAKIPFFEEPHCADKLITLAGVCSLQYSNDVHSTTDVPSNSPDASDSSDSESKLRIDEGWTKAPEVKNPEKIEVKTPRRYRTKAELKCLSLDEKITSSSEDDVPLTARIQKTLQKREIIRRGRKPSSLATQKTPPSTPKRGRGGRQPTLRRSHSQKTSTEVQKKNPESSYTSKLRSRSKSTSDKDKNAIEELLIQEEELVSKPPKRRGPKPKKPTKETPVLVQEEPVPVPIEKPKEPPLKSTLLQPYLTEEISLSPIPPPKKRYSKPNHPYLANNIARLQKILGTSVTEYPPVANLPKSDPEPNEEANILMIRHTADFISKNVSEVKSDCDKESADTANPLVQNPLVSIAEVIEESRTTEPRFDYSIASLLKDKGGESRRASVDHHYPDPEPITQYPIYNGEAYHDINKQEYYSTEVESCRKPDESFYGYEEEVVTNFDPDKENQNKIYDYSMQKPLERFPPDGGNICNEQISAVRPFFDSTLHASVFMPASDSLQQSHTVSYPPSEEPAPLQDFQQEKPFSAEIPKKELKNLADKIVDNLILGGNLTEDGSMVAMLPGGSQTKVEVICDHLKTKKMAEKIKGVKDPSDTVKPEEEQHRKRSKELIVDLPRSRESSVESIKEAFKLKAPSGDGNDTKSRNRRKSSDQRRRLGSKRKLTSEVILASEDDDGKKDHSNEVFGANKNRGEGSKITREEENKTVDLLKSKRPRPIPEEPQGSGKGLRKPNSDSNLDAELDLLTPKESSKIQETSLIKDNSCGEVKKNRSKVATKNLELSESLEKVEVVTVDTEHKSGPSKPPMEPSNPLLITSNETKIEKADIERRPGRSKANVLEKDKIADTPETDKEPFKNHEISKDLLHSNSNFETVTSSSSSDLLVKGTEKPGQTVEELSKRDIAFAKRESLTKDSSKHQDSSKKSPHSSLTGPSEEQVFEKHEGDESSENHPDLMHGETRTTLSNNQKTNLSNSDTAENKLENFNAIAENFEGEMLLVEREETATEKPSENQKPLEKKEQEEVETVKKILEETPEEKESISGEAEETAIKKPNTDVDKSSDSQETVSDTLKTSDVIESPNVQDYSKESLDSTKTINDSLEKDNINFMEKPYEVAPNGRRGRSKAKIESSKSSDSSIEPRDLKAVTSESLEHHKVKEATATVEKPCGVSTDGKTDYSRVKDESVETLNSNIIRSDSLEKEKESMILNRALNDSLETLDKRCCSTAKDESLTSDNYSKDLNITTSDSLEKDKESLVSNTTKNKSSEKQKKQNVSLEVTSDDRRGRSKAKNESSKSSDSSKGSLHSGITKSDSLEKDKTSLASHTIKNESLEQKKMQNVTSEVTPDGRRGRSKSKNEQSKGSDSLQLDITKGDSLEKDKESLALHTIRNESSEKERMENMTLEVTPDGRRGRSKSKNERSKISDLSKDLLQLDITKGDSLEKNKESLALHTTKTESSEKEKIENTTLEVTPDGRRGRSKAKNESFKSSDSNKESLDLNATISDSLKHDKGNEAITTLDKSDGAVACSVKSRSKAKNESVKTLNSYITKNDSLEKDKESMVSNTTPNDSIETPEKRSSSRTKDASLKSDNSNKDPLHSDITKGDSLKKDKGSNITKHESSEKDKIENRVRSKVKSESSKSYNLGKESLHPNKSITDSEHHKIVGEKSCEESSDGRKGRSKTKNELSKSHSNDSYKDKIKNDVTSESRRGRSKAKDDSSKGRHDSHSESVNVINSGEKDKVENLCEATSDGRKSRSKAKAESSRGHFNKESMVVEKVEKLCDIKKSHSKAKDECSKSHNSSVTNSDSVGKEKVDKLFAAMEKPCDVTPDDKKGRSKAKEESSKSHGSLLGDALEKDKSTVEKPGEGTSDSRRGRSKTKHESSKSHDSNKHSLQSNINDSLEKDKLDKVEKLCEAKNESPKKRDTNVDSLEKEKPQADSKKVEQEGEPRRGRSKSSTESTIGFPEDTTGYRRGRSKTPRLGEVKNDEKTLSNRKRKSTENGHSVDRKKGRTDKLDGSKEDEKHTKDRGVTENKAEEKSKSLKEDKKRASKEDDRGSRSKERRSKEAKPEESAKSKNVKEEVRKSEDKKTEDAKVKEKVSKEKRHCSVEHEGKSVEKGKRKLEHATESGKKPRRKRDEHKHKTATEEKIKHKDLEQKERNLSETANAESKNFHAKNFPAKQGDEDSNGKPLTKELSDEAKKSNERLKSKSRSEEKSTTKSEHFRSPKDKKQSIFKPDEKRKVAESVKLYLRETLETVKSKNVTETSCKVEEKPKEDSGISIKPRNAAEKSHKVEEKPKDHGVSVKPKNVMEKSHKLEEKPKDSEVSVKFKNVTEKIHKAEEKQRDIVVPADIKNVTEKSHKFEDQLKEDSGVSVKPKDDSEKSHKVEEEPKEYSGVSVKPMNTTEKSHKVEEMVKDIGVPVKPKNVTQKSHKVEEKLKENSGVSVKPKDDSEKSRKVEEEPKEYSGVSVKPMNTTEKSHKVEEMVKDIGVPVKPKNVTQKSHKVEEKLKEDSGVSVKPKNDSEVSLKPKDTTEKSHKVEEKPKDIGVSVEPKNVMEKSHKVEEKPKEKTGEPVKAKHFTEKCNEKVKEKVKEDSRDSAQEPKSFTEKSHKLKLTPKEDFKVSVKLTENCKEQLEDEPKGDSVDLVEPKNITETVKDKSKEDSVEPIQLKTFTENSSKLEEKEKDSGESVKPKNLTEKNYNAKEKSKEDFGVSVKSKKFTDECKEKLEDVPKGNSMDLGEPKKSHKVEEKLREEEDSVKTDHNVKERPKKDAEMSVKLKHPAEIFKVHETHMESSGESVKPNSYIEKNRKAEVKLKQVSGVPVKSKNLTEENDKLQEKPQDSGQTAEKTVKSAEQVQELKMGGQEVKEAKPEIEVTVSMEKLTETREIEKKREVSCLAINAKVNDDIHEKLVSCGPLIPVKGANFKSETGIAQIAQLEPNNLTVNKSSTHLKPKLDPWTSAEIPASSECETSETYFQDFEFAVSHQEEVNDSPKAPDSPSPFMDPSVLQHLTEVCVKSEEVVCPVKEPTGELKLDPIIIPASIQETVDNKVTQDDLKSLPNTRNDKPKIQKVKISSDLLDLNQDPPAEHKLIKCKQLNQSDKKLYIVLDNIMENVSKQAKKRRLSMETISPVKKKLDLLVIPPGELESGPPPQKITRRTSTVEPLEKRNVEVEYLPQNLDLQILDHVHQGIDNSATLPEINDGFQDSHLFYTNPPAPQPPVMDQQQFESAYGSALEFDFFENESIVANNYSIANPDFDINFFPDNAVITSVLSTLAQGGGGGMKTDATTPSNETAQKFEHSYSSYGNGGAEVKKCDAGISRSRENAMADTASAIESILSEVDTVFNSQGASGHVVGQIGNYDPVYPEGNASNLPAQATPQSPKPSTVQQTMDSMIGGCTLEATLDEPNLQDLFQCNTIHERGISNIKSVGVEDSVEIDALDEPNHALQALFCLHSSKLQDADLKSLDIDDVVIREAEAQLNTSGDSDKAKIKPVINKEQEKLKTQKSDKRTLTFIQLKALKKPIEVKKPQPMIIPTRTSNRSRPKPPPRRKIVDFAGPVQGFVTVKPPHELLVTEEGSTIKQMVVKVEENVEKLPEIINVEVTKDDRVSATIIQNKPEPTIEELPKEPPPVPQTMDSMIGGCSIEPNLDESNLQEFFRCHTAGMKPAGVDDSNSSISGSLDGGLDESNLQPLFYLEPGSSKHEELHYADLKSLDIIDDVVIGDTEESELNTSFDMSQLEEETKGAEEVLEVPLNNPMGEHEIDFKTEEPEPELKIKNKKKTSSRTSARCKPRKVPSERSSVRVRPLHELSLEKPCVLKLPEEKILDLPSADIGASVSLESKPSCGRSAAIRKPLPPHRSPLREGTRQATKILNKALQISQTETEKKEELPKSLDPFDLLKDVPNQPLFEKQQKEAEKLNKKARKRPASKTCLKEESDSDSGTWDPEEGTCKKPNKSKSDPYQLEFVQSPDSTVYESNDINWVNSEGSKNKTKTDSKKCKSDPHEPGVKEDISYNKHTGQKSKTYKQESHKCKSEPYQPRFEESRRTTSSKKDDALHNSEGNKPHSSKSHPNSQSQENPRIKWKDVQYGWLQKLPEIYFHRSGNTLDRDGTSVKGSTYST
ncbi:titin-like isoform X2 [Anthonomus grandis grandis]|uniref:titin-like isoform X2 n=1 Tax=Anthonomus grandis grandis TaxID=2921223 RepID=UPI0021662153|nr:titin-like isoform X2 [Anthonomus grandis grandis]